MPSVRSTLALAASAAVLAACATGPDYVQPVPPGADSGAFVSSASPAFTQEAPPADWWRLFDDQALDGLVRQALEANKDVAIAQANLAQVRASLSETRAGRLPSTNASASAARVRNQDPASGSYGEGDSFSAGFDVSYEVDLFGRVGRSIEASRADADAAAAALESVRVSVAAETARAYADACAAGAQIAVADRTVALQQQTFDLTSRQLQVGAGTALDVASAAALVETSRDAALFRLAVLTGRPPSDAPEIAKLCKTVPQVASAIPVGDGASLLKRRPDVRQAERELAAATARIGVATASLYPTVTLGGAGRRSGRRLHLQHRPADLLELPEHRRGQGPHRPGGRGGRRLAGAVREGQSDGASGSRDGPDPVRPRAGASRDPDPGPRPERQGRPAGPAALQRRGRQLPPGPRRRAHAGRPRHPAGPVAGAGRHLPGGGVQGPGRRLGRSGGVIRFS